MYIHKELEYSQSVKPHSVVENRQRSLLCSALPDGGGTVGAWRTEETTFKTLHNLDLLLRQLSRIKEGNKALPGKALK